MPRNVSVGERGDANNGRPNRTREGPSESPTHNDPERARKARKAGRGQETKKQATRMWLVLTWPSRMSQSAAAKGHHLRPSAGATGRDETKMQSKHHGRVGWRSKHTREPLTTGRPTAHATDKALRSARAPPRTAPFRSAWHAPARPCARRCTRDRCSRNTARQRRGGTTRGQRTAPAAVPVAAATAATTA